jgi:hypothetical protein
MFLLLLFYVTYKVPLPLFMHKISNHSVNEFVERENGKKEKLF